MPCLILTGHPCSGKTTLAHVLCQRALQRDDLSQVVIIQDHSETEASTTTYSKNDTTVSSSASTSDSETTALHHSRQQKQQQQQEGVVAAATAAGLYQNAHAEKKTRGALKAAFDRALSSTTKHTLILVDSLNYIKGFRYELHCLSKAAGERHGVVWVLNDAAVEWNRQRRQATNSTTGTYTDEQMKELMLRYEPPDDRNRWDSPLYRVDMRPCNDSSSAWANSAQTALQRSVYNMHKLSDALMMDPQPDSSVSAQAQQSTNSVTTKKTSSAFRRRTPKGGGKTAASATTTNSMTTASDGTFPAVAEKDNVDCTQSKSSPLVNTTTTDSRSTTIKLEHTTTLQERVDQILDEFLRHVKPLEVGMSTRQHVASDTNVLHAVDTMTQRICSSIGAFQNNKKSSSRDASSTTTTVTTTISVTLSSGTTEILELTRDSNLLRLPMSQLQKLRHQYIGWVRHHPPEDSSEKGIARSFVAYVEAQDTR